MCREEIFNIGGGIDNSLYSLSFFNNSFHSFIFRFYCFWGYDYKTVLAEVKKREKPEDSMSDRP